MLITLLIFIYVFAIIGYLIGAPTYLYVRYLEAQVYKYANVGELVKDTD